MNAVHVYPDPGADIRALPIQYRINALTNCWECFSHALNSYGYPQLSRKSKAITIPRWVFAQVSGMDLKGLCVLHSCDNRTCINPAHLRAGSAADNVNDKTLRDRNAKGVKNAANKLTEKQVLAIRASKIPYSQLSLEYGVARGHIANIKAKRCWGWL